MLIKKNTLINLQNFATFIQKNMKSFKNLRNFYSYTEKNLPNKDKQ